MSERGRSIGYPYSDEEADLKQAQSEQGILEAQLVEKLRASGLFTDEELVAAIRSGKLEQLPEFLEDHANHLEGVPQTDH